MTRVVGIKPRQFAKVRYYAAVEVSLGVGDLCVYETEDGESVGEVAIAPLSLEEKRLPQPLRSVLRKATEEDAAKRENALLREQEALGFCRKRALERGLNMKVTHAEVRDGANRSIFYFTAEERVDFRELVKDLAHRFRVRVEMRQIGVRDEAKLSGGFGACGRRLCCSTWLSEFDPISIRMAKDQNLTLNPAKLSGLCGRLKCCLRYEHQDYRAAKAKMPPLGSNVRVPEGVGRVVRHDLLREDVTVELEGGRRCQCTCGKAQLVEA